MKNSVKDRSNAQASYARSPRARAIATVAPCLSDAAPPSRARAAPQVRGQLHLRAPAPGVRGRLAARRPGGAGLPQRARHRLRRGPRARHARSRWLPAAAVSRQIYSSRRSNTLLERARCLLRVGGVCWLVSRASAPGLRPARQHPIPFDPLGLRSDLPCTVGDCRVPVHATLAWVPSREQGRSRARLA